MASDDANDDNRKGVSGIMKDGSLGLKHDGYCMKILWYPSRCWFKSSIGDTATTLRLT
jgi:hypothetical protein